MNKYGVMCGLTFVAALGQSSAFALVGGSVDANLASSPWASVGSITISGGVYSGVLLDSQHVLTAAHVVGGLVGTPGNVSFSLNVGGDLPTPTVPPQRYQSMTATPARCPGRTAFGTMTWRLSA